MSNSVDLMMANKALSFANPLPMMDYPTAVALGYVPGARPFRVIGTNTDIDNVREDIWELGGDYTFPPAGGLQMRVVSSSSSDALGQVGARKVHIHYLDAAGAEKSEEITMTGTVPVNTVATDIWRVQGFHVIEAGSTALAAGDISLTNTGGTVAYARISALSNRTRQAIWTVPAGKRGIVTEVWIGGSSDVGSLANFAEGYLRATMDFTTGELNPGLFNFYYVVMAASDTIGGALSVPIVLPPLCDVKISLISRASNSNVRATASFAGWIENT